MSKDKKMKISYRSVLVADSNNFALVENFKTIRTNLLYSARGEKCPIFAVTSCFAHAGKSVVLANLSIAFAQLGKKVLLIDMDMRCPVQHKIFHKDNRYGSSELLAEIASEDGVIFRESGYKNLTLLTAGRIPPNPSELLASERLAGLLQGFREEYDYIFIDLPPASVVTDALLVSEQVTGYIFVVRAELDDIRVVRAQVEDFRQNGARVLGTVLNDVTVEGGRFRNGGYHSNYRYDYGYGYGHTNARAQDVKTDE